MKTIMDKWRCESANSRTDPFINAGAGRAGACISGAKADPFLDAIIVLRLNAPLPRWNQFFYMKPEVSAVLSARVLAVRGLGLVFKHDQVSMQEVRLGARAIARPGVLSCKAAWSWPEQRVR